MDPRDKLAVVTGAAGGIGGALVRALLDAGAAHVVATDLSADGIAGGERVERRALDVSDAAATVALVEDVTDARGPIDLWFANAGIAVGGGFDAPDERWQRQWEVNVMSHVYAARALFPGWIARGEGHLVTTASMAGILTSLGDGVYAAAKHAAVGLAEWLAITHAEHGITVSCVCPGAVDTAMLRGGAGGDAARATAAIGGGDVLSPDEAARRVIDAVREDRFLIYTHPEMHEFVTRKADDPDRWIRGMSRLWQRSQQLLAD
jgi:NAD(P)-dependent dehydrogenase (short-subunit alcohol dehydrogenase family)